jgi:hypothetical protein
MWYISGAIDSYVDDKDKIASEEPDAFEAVLKTFAKKNAKTRHKLKAHTNKIVSSFKTPQLSSAVVKEYRVRFQGPDSPTELVGIC